jgi:hypothetical protein
MPNKNNSQFDSPWKEIIEFFFPQFMEFFVPESVADIDWNKKIKSFCTIPKNFNNAPGNFHHCL